MQEQFPPEIRSELEAAIKFVMSGKRDPDRMREACERMDLLRESIRKRQGVLDIGVPAIRELRGEIE